MNLFTFPLFCALIACLLATTVLGASDYNEKLVVQPLPPSNLYTSFNFQSNESLIAFNQHNFRHFPRSLGQILQHANTKELHIRFTTGRWDAENWGERPWNGYKEGGTGVELWAWIEADNDEAAYNNWITLTQSLSGLFCASLNFIDSTRTTKPLFTFQPSRNHSTTKGNLHLLHGALPGEVVCTENLTPFLKLMPCKGKAGISSLLDGHWLFDASWQSMSIDVSPTCPEGLGHCQIELDQTVDMVLDISRSKRSRSNLIPRPVPAEDLTCDQSKTYNSGDTCYPVDASYPQSWSLSEVFGHKIPHSCPLTEDIDSTVTLVVPPERKIISSPSSSRRPGPDGKSIGYSIPPDTYFDLDIPAEEASPGIPLEQPVLHVERTIIGNGQERGGLRSILTNPSSTEGVDFVYFEDLPWFMRPYLHTMRTKITDKNGISRDVPPAEIVKDVFYRPAVDRKRGTQLELVLSVPAASTVTLTYDFEKAILRYTEYPPDANRGFNVAPAVIRILGGDDNGTSNPIYLRTTSLLLSLPTPDFSMPYNVIILTSTVIALAFGNIFNLLVRRFVAAEELPPRNIKTIIVGKFVALKDKLSGKSTKVE